MDNLAQCAHPRVSCRKSLGFTLVEVMVVVGIISIMMVALITILNPARQFAKARDANRQSNLAILATALEQYYADYNAYPPDTGGGAGGDTTGMTCVERTLVTGDADCSGDSGDDTFLKLMASDTKESDGYHYCYTAIGASSYQDYLLCARLEVGEDNIPSGYAGSVCTDDSVGNGDYCITSPF